ncbi:MAG: hypothetical protein ACQER9_03745 [Nanobdellota archaeon]
MYNKKRGQISVYILLGITMLLIISLVSITLTKEKGEEKVTDYFPEDLSPAEKHVTSCLKTTLKDAVIKAGMQGGYLELPKEKYSNPSNYIKQGNMKVPLWIIGNEYVYPSTEDLEKDIQLYIQDNIKRCIQRMNEVESVKGFNIHDEPQANVSINNKDVTAFLHQKIKVQKNNKQSTITRYATKIPIKLKKILETAAFINKANTQDAFIGDTTVNLLSLDPEIPIGDLKMSCKPLRWRKSKVKEKIQNHLTYLLPNIRISGTEYKPFKYNKEVYERITKKWDSDKVAQKGLPENLPEDMYDYTQHFWDIGEKNFKDINIGLSYYPSYGMKMQVNPSSGDMISSNAGRSGYDFLKYLCVNIYHFTYDMTYPVKVTLYDKNAFNHDGYMFTFAMPIRIQHNIPVNHPPHFTYTGATDTSESFCNLKRDYKTTVTAYDYFTGEYLSGVDVKYDCLKYFCDLGETNNEHNVNLPDLKKGLPLGSSNCVFIADKEGYIKEKKQKQNEEHVEIPLIPLKEFNYEFTELDYTKFSDKYTATITLESKNHDFEKFLIYPEDFTGGQKMKLPLIQGPEEYDLEIYLFYEDNIVGGWIGNWTVTENDLTKNNIIFHALEWPELVRNQDTETILALYQHLEENPENDPYRELYAPEFR